MLARLSDGFSYIFIFKKHILLSNQTFQSNPRGWRTSQPWTFQTQASTPNFSTINFSTPDFSTMGLKSSWFKCLGLKCLGLKSLGLKCHLSRKLKGHSTMDLSTLELSIPDFSTPWLKSPGLKELKLGVKKSGVEMSFNLWKVLMKLCLGKKSSVEHLKIQMNIKKMREGVKRKATNQDAPC